MKTFSLKTDNNTSHWFTTDKYKKKMLKETIKKEGIVIRHIHKSHNDGSKYQVNFIVLYLHGSCTLFRENLCYGIVFFFALMYDHVKVEGMVRWFCRVGRGIERWSSWMTIQGEDMISDHFSKSDFIWIVIRGCSRRTFLRWEEGEGGQKAFIGEENTNEEKSL
jgi:hypothetical protein